MTLNKQTNEIIKQQTNEDAQSLSFIQILNFDNSSKVIPTPLNKNLIKQGKMFDITTTAKYRIVTLTKTYKSNKQGQSITIRYRTFENQNETFNCVSKSQCTIISPQGDEKNWPSNINKYLNEFSNSKTTEEKITPALLPLITPKHPGNTFSKPKLIIKPEDKIEEEEDEHQPAKKIEIPNATLKLIQQINGRKQERHTKTQIVMKNGERVIINKTVNNFMAGRNPNEDKSIFIVREISFIPYYNYDQQNFAWTMNVIYFKVNKGEACEFKNINVKLPAFKGCHKINSRVEPPNAIKNFLPNVRVPKKPQKKQIA